MKKIAAMKKTIALALFSAFVFFGCREEVNLQDPYDYYNKDNIYKTKWSDIFEGFWTGMNNNYVFWDIDTTNWDAVYDTYMPYFQSLGTFIQTTDSQYYRIDKCFTDMLANIVDGHFQMTCAWDDPSTSNKDNFVVSPSLNRLINNAPKDILLEAAYETTIIVKDSNGDYHIKPDFVDAVKSELDPNYYIFNYTYTIEKTTHTLNVATGYKEVDGGIILYFHFTNFWWAELLSLFDYTFPSGSNDANYIAIDNALDKCFDPAKTVREITGFEYDSDTDSYVPSKDLTALLNSLSNSPILQGVWKNRIYARAAKEHFDYFFDNLNAGTLNGETICGAIIDIRGNGGGYVEDLSTLWGRIVPGDFTFAKQKYKYGDNRYDFVPQLIDYKIFKNPNDTSGGVTDIPLVLLVNKGSVSCSELTALFFKALRSEGINQTSYVVGGTTWGGQGVLTTSDTFNAGQFTVAGGIINMVYTPSVQVRSLSGESFEGVGVTPDIEVPFDYDKMTSGTDDRLQKAINVIITGHP